MSNVIDIERAREVWMHGLGACGLCGRLWIGVVHKDTLFRLECPGCGEMSGVFVPAWALDEGGLQELREDYEDRFHQDVIDLGIPF